MNSQEPVYLIDGSAYIYRAYHAIAPLTNSKGLPTHAVLGFTNMLLRVIREKQPKYLAIAFDMRGPTFRHEMYSEYKANRPPMPDDLACQIPFIKDMARAHNILSLEEQGFEADDFLASAAKIIEQQNHPVILISGDKDLLQLVSDKVTMWDPMRDKIMDPAAVTKKYNVPPNMLLDLFSLIGDSSDNVPGVPGVGPKTAEKLLNQFETLEGLYENLDNITQKKLKEKLSDNKDQAFLSRQLIALKMDLEVPQSLDSYALQEADNEKLRELYTELEFTRLLKEQTTTPALSHDGFQLIQSESTLKELATSLTQKEMVVLDTETNSLNPLTTELVGISLCATRKEAYYIPIGHRDESGDLVAGQLPCDTALDILRPLLQNKDIAKLGHNLKFDYQVFQTHGLTLEGPLWDTLIASYLIDPSKRSHKLDDLCEDIIDQRLTSFSEVTNKDKRPDAFAYVDLTAACDYSCEDVVGAYLLWQHFQSQLKDLDLWQLFADLEIRLIPILAQMERAGVLVDSEFLDTMSEELDAQLKEIETTIYELAEEEFNINSPKQLGTILFEKLELPHGRKTKTGYSTDAKVLEKLASIHELPAAVINHRNLSKLKSTYVDKLTTLIQPHSGRVHTSFNQAVTATGRLSSSNPNLQNIPIRTPEGQRIREAFVAAPGHLFLSADYSQIDLRVLAHYSQDAALLEAFRKGEDIHKQTAAEIFQVNAAFLTPEMRRVAKTINFGIIYGMSAFGLSNQLNISRKEAGTFIERYFSHYAGVKQFMEDIVIQAQEDGFVTTLLKRRRLLPEIKSPNKTRREFAERTAINTPIQGTAADIIKLATIATVEQLKQEKLQAALLLQIHDELVFEVPEGEIEKTEQLVKEAMEHVMELDVPLVVNTTVGKNLSKV